MAPHPTLARALCAGALWLAAVAPAWAVAPALATPSRVDVLVTYETRQVTSAGVTRTERWQERLVRRGDTVWTARVLPAGGAALHASESAAEHAGHKHFDFESAGRLVERAASGELRVRFVDRERKVVVNVPRAEYGAVGFDGQWDGAAYIVPPAVVARMGTATADGWRAEKAKGWSHRLRWSAAQQLPVRVESRRDDGSVTRVVSVTPMPASATVPWEGIDAIAQKDYDDFMD